MSKNNDRDHFEEYREQTAVKHDILAAYLPAYFAILGPSNKNLVLIDGFAGRGTYRDSETDESIDGSPLRALNLIAASDKFRSKVSTIFIEADSNLFIQMEAAVAEFYASHKEIREPRCIHATFADGVAAVLSGLSGNLAPTFLFVDPCGVSGVKLDTIRSVMQYDKCEAFVFFNVDGIGRTAGLGPQNVALVELMGSKARAEQICDELKSNRTSFSREQLILSHYQAAMRESFGAKYFVPFRVEYENSKKASHYLIHVAKHHLGFRIMKDVMWKRGQGQFNQSGLFLDQASRTDYLPLFDIDGNAAKQAILDSLKGGPERVSVFCTDWPERPDDLIAPSAYKQYLLELEAKQRIEVLSKDRSTVKSASARPKKDGKSTLGEDYFVRLAAS